VNDNLALLVKFVNKKRSSLEPNTVNMLAWLCSWLSVGLLIAVALRYRYCSGATFTVAVAIAPLLLAESSGDSSAATFLAAF